ncbi:hypothetical protein MMH89_00200 [Candidatus Comchoanobacter bicostacola]|uniref:Uncharacterized protein n=1 Tax=Candidatus Comchoanobacter bicostacola TaxID=2919598 RepID=A0ABY5DKS7_9GAMM|nr:hypothetical protein [Candidatus Comchoanobacter bicostacola]UTC24587.1 hypothetical protein MMH89_00200 [Candidatus Comchoanobacter bicostacola]
MNMFDDMVEAALEIEYDASECDRLNERLSQQAFAPDAVQEILQGHFLRGHGMGNNFGIQLIQARTEIQLNGRLSQPTYQALKNAVALDQPVAAAPAQQFAGPVGHLAPRSLFG